MHIKKSRRPCKILLKGTLYIKDPEFLYKFSDEEKQKISNILDNCHHRIDNWIDDETRKMLLEDNNYDG